MPAATEPVHAAPERKDETVRRIAPDAFRALVAERIGPLLGLCRYLERQPLGTTALTRPLLTRLIGQSALLEELLDAYGARNNRRWHTLRHLFASVHLFSVNCYRLLHIEHSIEAYRLLPVEGAFRDETLEALQFASDVVMLLAGRIIAETRAQRVAPEADPLQTEEFEERLPPGILPHDRKARHVESAEETVVNLATAFLEGASESKLLHSCRSVGPGQCRLLLPDPLSEERLRGIEQRFHNLQSLYDTFVSDTDTEELDRNLPVLRGHVSVIFHLLEIATDLAHYYERHMLIAPSETTPAGQRPLVGPDALLETLVHYALAYASRYLERACGLCHGMLRRYAEIGEITVPVPGYRGFHVRPSTLVAKIVRHYGSEVIMILNDMEYDAGAPLDLFRANEVINAEKRRRLAQEICRMPLGKVGTHPEVVAGEVRDIVMRLSEKGKIVLYQHPLEINAPAEPDPELSLCQLVIDQVALLLAEGKIDIESKLSVSFRGDTRVLEDIRRLAENGYGEDAFGNNIPLPEELRYLRR